MDLDDLLKKMVRGGMGGGFSKKQKKKDFEDRLAEGVLMALGMAGAYALGRATGAPPQGQAVPPRALPPPPPGVGPASSLPPPPSAWPPPPPPQAQQPAASATPSDRRSLILVRGMVAAANADHQVDEDERRRIFSKAEFLGLTEEERRFLHHEFDRPATIQALAREIAGDVGLSRQVYLASLLVLDLDTDAERFYLARLAEALAIPESEVRELHEQAAL